MKAVWDACRTAGIDVPRAVKEFFDRDIEFGEPDPKGMRIDLAKHESVTSWSGDEVEGFEIAIAKLPKGVTHIRFKNSW